MNAAGAWFGAMPCCCGAGGLAAQVATQCCWSCALTSETFSHALVGGRRLGTVQGRVRGPEGQTGLKGRTGWQVRFGARTGAAPMFLGAVKVALGLLFGDSLFRLLRAFPRPLLGSMLVFSGARLPALPARLSLPAAPLRQPVLVRGRHLAARVDPLAPVLAV